MRERTHMDSHTQIHAHTQNTHTIHRTHIETEQTNRQTDTQNTLITLTGDIDGYHQ